LVWQVWLGPEGFGDVQQSGRLGSAAQQGSFPAGRLAVTGLEEAQCEQEDSGFGARARSRRRVVRQPRASGLSA
jgi:hypothetical protein